MTDEAGQRAIGKDSDRRGVEAIWHRCANGHKLDVFAHATLVDAQPFHEWNGEHPVDANTTVRTYPAGTRVLVMMASRLGDFGIRARSIDTLSMGYDCRLDPEQLCDFVPKWKGADHA